MGYLPIQRSFYPALTSLIAHYAERRDGGLLAKKIHESDIEDSVIKSHQAPNNSSPLNGSPLNGSLAENSLLEVYHLFFEGL